MGMTVSKWLFGQSPESKISTLPTMSPQQQALLNKLLGEFDQESLLKGGATPYGGELVAGLGDLENLSLEALEQKILQRATSEGVGAEAETALTKMLRTGGAPTDFEEFYRTSVRDPALQEFREFTLPEVTRRFGSSGAFGSDRLTAEQQGLERLGRTLTGARSELAFKTQESSQERILKALGLAPGVEGSDVESLLKLMQGASLPRSIQQAKLTSEYGEFQRQQEEKRNRVNQILAALGLPTLQNIPQTTPGQTGTLQSVLTAAAGNTGAAAGFFAAGA